MELYEINQQLKALVDPDTGELLDIDVFQQLMLERDEKIEGMALWYKNAAAEAKAVKEEADALIKRARSLESLSERLKSYLGLMLDGEKFSTTRCVVSFRKSSGLEITDQAAIIEWAEKTEHYECLRCKPPEIEKKAVSELLKSGADVPCARIICKNNVTIR